MYVKFYKKNVWVRGVNDFGKKRAAMAVDLRLCTTGNRNHSLQTKDMQYFILNWPLFCLLGSFFGFLFDMLYNLICDDGQYRFDSILESGNTALFYV